MRKIGILGGTFNPVHIGHLAIAQRAMEAMGLEEVIFVPANIPPHKRPTCLAPARHRYEMVRAAIAANPGFRISDFEIRRPGKSYTVETLRHFRERMPEARLFFIIGQDSYPQLPRWKSIEEILNLAEFVIVTRPGCGQVKAGPRLHIVVMPGIHVSSSYLRRRIAQGRSVKYFVPDEVEAYIRRHRLYDSKKKET